ncbi:hypothetical protein GN956_G21583 [Arapaima gigas]
MNSTCHFTDMYNRTIAKLFNENFHDTWSIASFIVTASSDTDTKLNEPSNECSIQKLLKFVQQNHHKAV